MATYFLDTSALVKRYVEEVGSQWVRDLCEPASGNLIIISQATLVETVAALCRKALSGSMSPADRNRAIAIFRGDAQQNYGREQVTDTIYTRAGDLCQTHNLRAYDAVQLACALNLRDKLAPLGIMPIFVSADTALVGFATHEGLQTDNPNLHP